MEPHAIAIDTTAPANGHFWQAALDSLVAHIAILDSEGRILAVNAAWRRFASKNGQTDPNACIGVNYLAICDGALAGEDGAEGAAAAEGIRAVFSGKRKEFFLSYPCHSPVKKRWFMLRVSRFAGPAPAHVVVAHENITAPKAAQMRATRAARELESANGELRRQATELQRAEALEADSNGILERIARNELLDTILYEIAALLERREPDLYCAVIRLQNQRVEIAAAPTLPESLLERLRTLTMASLPPAGDSSLAQLIRAVGFAGAPDLQPFCLVPIPSQTRPPAAWLAVAQTQGDQTPAVSLAIARAASLATLALDHAALYEKLSFLAGHDSLTEVPNRLLFRERLQNAATRSPRDGWTFAVGMLDLDRFKPVNDLYGHRFGDTLLRQAAHRILKCVRPGDTVARLSGDEFAIILDNLRDTKEADQIAARIIMAFEELFPVFDQKLRITASLGFSLFPDDASEPTALVRNANTALDCCKSQGRNICQRYDSTFGVMALERLEIERHLRDAVEQGELQVHYQLQFDMDRRVYGMEALVRWHSPVLGSVSPGKFIPVAENTGIVTEIGNFVLRRACLQSVEWRRSGLPPTRIAVNVSTVQLLRPGFADYVSSVLEETGLSPALLDLEITESAMLTNLGNVVREMEMLRKLGIAISIDDFGTGYSSLSYLQNLPVDTIKIDRSFISELDCNSTGGTSIVRAIITLAHSLNLTVVAEGIETEAQFDALSALECDIIQGYLLHRPCAADALARILAGTMVETSHLLAPQR